MKLSIPRNQRKHKGIFGGITPDNSMVAVQNETNKLDEKHDASCLCTRCQKNSFYNTFATKSWMQDLMEKGYPSPLVKELSDDGSKLWFSQNDDDFVAHLHNGRLSRVEKATFARPPEVKTTEIAQTDPVIEDIMNDE